MTNICQDQLLVGAGQEIEKRRKESRETVPELRTVTGGGPELLSSGKTENFIKITEDSNA